MESKNKISVNELKDITGGENRKIHKNMYKVINVIGTRIHNKASKFQRLLVVILLA